MIARAVFALCLFLAALAPAAAQRAGTYGVRGTVPGTNATYEGTAQLTMVSSNTFRVRWTIGQTTTDGFGTTYENWFVVGYNSGGRQGVAAYWLDPATGVLTGQWATDGTDGMGAEVMTPR